MQTLTLIWIITTLAITHGFADDNPFEIFSVYGGGYYPRTINTPLAKVGYWLAAHNPKFYVITNHGHDPKAVMHWAEHFRKLQDRKPIFTTACGYGGCDALELSKLLKGRVVVGVREGILIDSYPLPPYEWNPVVKDTRPAAVRNLSIPPEAGLRAYYTLPEGKTVVGYLSDPDLTFPKTPPGGITSSSFGQIEGYQLDKSVARELAEFYKNPDAYMKKYGMHTNVPHNFPLPRTSAALKSLGGLSISTAAGAGMAMLGEEPFGEEAAAASGILTGSALNVIIVGGGSATFWEGAAVGAFGYGAYRFADAVADPLYECIANKTVRPWTKEIIERRKRDALHDEHRILYDEFRNR